MFNDNRYSPHQKGHDAEAKTSLHIQYHIAKNKIDARIMAYRVKYIDLIPELDITDKEKTTDLLLDMQLEAESVIKKITRLQLAFSGNALEAPDS